MNQISDETLKALRQPFHPSHVTWKPGNVRHDGTAAEAHASASIRAYQERLDEVCGMNWSVSYVPWGERIVCHLTISGVTRSSSGEGDTASETEAIAFRRACAMFGLGRYLIALPSVWVEYDPTNKRFCDRGSAKLEGIIVQHYRRHTMEQVQA